MTEEAEHKLAAHVVDGGRLRALVLELWQRTRMDWGFVTDRLAVTFRKEKWIGAHERRFVGETLYGMVRHLRRIDAALLRGTPTKRAPRDLERLLALLVLERMIEPAHARRVAPDLDWTAIPGIDAQIAGERNATKRIALAASLPDWLAARLVADWGAERAERLARALNQRAPMTVRANLLVGDRAALAAELAKEKIATTPGDHCDTALLLASRTNLFALEAFQRGAMEAQDEGSQLLADLAIAGPSGAGGERVPVRGPFVPGPSGTSGKGSAAGGERVPVRGPFVIDLCAGAGGKTLAMAARLGNRGRILACDIDDKKLEELRRRARRAGVTNAQAVQLAGGSWPAALDAQRGKADIVLVDAPCSGIGALRRNPEARWRLAEADLAQFARKQREILDNAVHLLAPGGRLVYATCTVTRTENEEVVAAVLAANPVLAAASEPFHVAPDTHGTDGFFAQVLHARTP